MSLCQSSVGDGPGRHRPEEHQVDAALDSSHFLFTSWLTTTMTKHRCIIELDTGPKEAAYSVRLLELLEDVLDKSF